MQNTEVLIEELRLLSDCLHKTVDSLVTDQEKTAWDKACGSLDTLILILGQR